MGLTRRLATGLIIKNAGVGSLRDLKDIMDDPSMRLSATPFGAVGPWDTLYVGNPAPWKGYRPGSVDRFYATWPGPGSGLRKAVDISIKCAGKHGVARHPKFGYFIPAKALCQIEEGPVKTSLKRYVRVTQLIK